MTGFGMASRGIDGREMTIEIKSVNHRYLDLGFRMSRHIGFIEDTLRVTLSEMLSRGHVDVYVNYRNTRRDARTVTVDSALLSEYISAARKANEALGLTDDVTLSSVLRLPDVTEIVEAEEDREAVERLAKEMLVAAVEELKRMRAKEGGRLYADLRARADTVENLRREIAERAPIVVEEYRVKLSERIQGMLEAVEVDRARLATEVALFADKASIDEEIVRLGSHVAQYIALLEGDEPAGRKLDFIVQEMNREFNTMGSKANDVEIVNRVLAGKAEVEKIREQIQNIE
jgi:uncharacterized protein (TIGR00255 family)